VILSVPASVNRNAPLVSLVPSIEPQGSNGAKTIPFKNVLDGLDAFGAAGDDNAAEEQKASSQGAIFKKNPPDPTPGKPLNSATPHSAPQIQFRNQNLAQLTATLARPTEEAAQPKQNSSPENTGSQHNAASLQDSSIADAFAAPSTEAAEQEHTEPSPAKNAQRPVVESSTAPASGSHGITLAPAARFAVNVPAPSAPSVRVIPAKTIAAAPSVAISQAQTRVVVTSSLATAPPQAQPARGASVQVKAAPTESDAPIKPEVKPMESAKATPVTEAQPAPARQVSLQRPPAVPAAQIRTEGRSAFEASQPDAASEKIAEPATHAPTTSVPATPVTTLPSPVETAAVTTSVATAAAPTAITQPPAPSAKPKDASSRQSVSPASNAPSTSAPPAATRIAPVAGPAAKGADSARPDSGTPDSSATPRSEAERTTAAVDAATKTPQTPLAPRAENFAFAVRMLAPDNTPIEQTKPAVTLAEPQISEPNPSVNQPNPAPAPASENQQPQPQSQASTDSKRDTQSPAPASEKTDPRAPKTVELPQPADVRQTFTRWSEVNAMQPSEVSSARVSSDLAEPAHASPALAAQETHVMAPELPKTSSTSSEILLHLTGNDQSSAAIRVAERAGSVNVTVHASDPVLRESLRSNLGELSTQLSQQGWKAEALKPAAIAAQQESQQDSHGGGQRSSQQQSFGGDRQPQRDRRAPGAHWQQELEQQISSGDAHPGGNR
jgi:hypothetical protein